MKKLLLGVSCVLAVQASYAASEYCSEDSPCFTDVTNKLDGELLFVYNQWGNPSESFNYDQWVKSIKTANSPFNGTNKIYAVLRKRYGLNEPVECKKYKASQHSEEEYKKIGYASDFAKRTVLYSPVQKLGDTDDFGLSQSMSLSNDINSVVVQTIYLNNPETKSGDMDKIRGDRDLYMKFINKSCGTAFVNSFNRFLNDFGKEAGAAYQVKIDQETTAQRMVQQEQQEAIAEQNEFDRQVRANTVARNKVAECKASNRYALYLEQNKVVIARNGIDRAKADLARDDQAAKIGGVSNKSLRYSASNRLISSTEIMNKAFSKYKNLGGTASSPERVVKPSNPCE